MPFPDDVMANDAMQIVLYDCDCPFGNNYTEKRIHMKCNAGKHKQFYPAITKTIRVAMSNGERPMEKCGTA